MNRYFKTRKELVQFVRNQLPTLTSDLPWTMTIKQGKYEGFYVSIATKSLSVDIGKDVS